MATKRFTFIPLKEACYRCVNSKGIFYTMSALIDDLAYWTMTAAAISDAIVPDFDNKEYERLRKRIVNLVAKEQHKMIEANRKHTKET